MDRKKGTFGFTANYEVKLQELLDPRGGVTNKEDLINKETFPYDENTIYMKEGMLVSVSSTREVYMLVSLANILAADYSGWVKVAGVGNNSTGSNAPLPEQSINTELLEAFIPLPRDFSNDFNNDFAR